MRSFRLNDILLFETMDFDSLILEGKDPMEILHYKFDKTIPSEIVDQIASIDPTKKKSYTQWTLSQFNEYKDTILTALKNGRLKSLFDYCKEHNQEIQLKDIENIEVALKEYVPLSDPIFTPSKNEEANEYETVFDNENWRICVPHTYEAEEKLGENTRWCTAGCYGNGEYYYDDYTSNGKLYVNFDKRSSQVLNGKEYPYTRYQFHFESTSFMDAYDDSILDEIQEIVPQEVMDFYEEEGYDVTNLENQEIKLERYENWRYEKSLKVNDDLRLMPEWDDDLDIIEDDYSITYKLYHSDDDRDTSFSFYYSTYDNIEDTDIIKFANNISCILEDNSENLFFFYQENENDWDYYLIFKNYLINDNEDIFFIYGNTTLAFAAFIDGNLLECSTVNFSEDTMIRYSSLGDDIYDYGCIEIIDESKGHTLLGINYDDIEVIIARDYPINRKFFEVDENGIIHAQYRNYRLSDGDEDEYDENEDFQVDNKLTDNTLLVHRKKNWNDVYNVFSLQTRQFLLDEWLPTGSIIKLFNPNYNYILITPLREGRYIIDEDGIKLTKTYHFDIIPLTAKLPYAVGFNRDEDKKQLIGDLYDLNSRKLIADGVKLQGLISNKYIGYINWYTDMTQVLYDLENDEKISIDGNLTKIRYDYTLGQNNNIIIVNKGSKTYSFIDLNTFESITDNVTNVKKLDDFSFDYFGIKTDSWHLFDSINGKVIPLNNVKNIGAVKNAFNVNRYYCLLYSNNLVQVYDIPNNKIIISVNTAELANVYMYTHDKICFQTNNRYMFYYNLESNKITDQYNQPIETEGRNEEYIDTMKRLFLSDNNIQESFKSMFNRLMEIEKRNKPIFFN